MAFKTAYSMACHSSRLAHPFLGHSGNFMCHVACEIFIVESRLVSDDACPSGRLYYGKLARLTVFENRGAAMLSRLYYGIPFIQASAPNSWTHVGENPPCC